MRYGVFLLSLLTLPAQGQTTSYHIGNSLTADGITYLSGGQLSGLQALATGYGFQHQVAYHIDTGRSLGQIWQAPENVDISLSPYGAFDNALPNYEWNSVVLEPYFSGGSTLGSDGTNIQNFINLTQTNPANSATIYYIYQVWPKQSLGDFVSYWTGLSVDADSTPTTPRRQFYDNLMNSLTATNLPLGNIIREIPTGEVLYELANMINNESLPGVSSFSEFYRDDTHFSTLGRYVASSTIAATLFQIDIRGTVPPTTHYNFSPELVSAINETVWNVVSGHPYSGLGDFNDDGIVDQTDYMVWSTAYGSSDFGDGNGDGTTDGIDFLIWQRQFQGNLASSIVTVPEPGTNMLFWIALVVVVTYAGRARTIQSMRSLKKSEFRPTLSKQPNFHRRLKAEIT